MDVRRSGSYKCFLRFPFDKPVPSCQIPVFIPFIFLLPFSSIDRLMAFMPVFTAVQSLDILLDTSLQFPHCGLSWCWEFIEKKKDLLENGFWDSIWRRKLYCVLWSEANMG